MPKFLPVVAAVAVAIACQSKPAALSDADRAAVSDTVAAIVRGLFDAADHLDAGRLLSRYSTDPDVRVVDNGVVYPFVDRYRARTDSAYGQLRALEIKPSEIRTMVLAANAAATQVPFTFTATNKAGTTVGGAGVYSALLQKRGGVWKIVRSHESEQNVETLKAQLFPPARGRR